MTSSVAASSQTAENGVVLFMTLGATHGTKLTITSLPEAAILHKAKPAIPEANQKWSHALASEFPELANKSDEDLNAAIKHMREN